MDEQEGTRAGGMGKAFFTKAAAAGLMAGMICLSITYDLAEAPAAKEVGHIEEAPVISDQEQRDREVPYSNDQYLYDIDQSYARELGSRQEKIWSEMKIKDENKPVPAVKTRTGKPSNDTAMMNKTLNAYVLEVIKAYKIGRYPYLLNEDYEHYNGVTQNLYYQGQLLLKASPDGSRASHCVGITFEVFFKAMQNRNKDLGLPLDDFNGMTWDELYDFALTWYVANGPKSVSNIAAAVQKYGLGTRIMNLEAAQPGDFIDFSRENDTGHTVVFIDWIRKGKQIIGLKYWSSQGSTHGISYKKEYFNVPRSDGEKYGNVMKDSLYIARIYPVSKYRK